MTLNSELFQSEFSVLSGRLIINLKKICFPCTYVDKMFIQQRLVFSFIFSFTIFLLMLFSLFSNVFTNILKIYELPKIYNKILKKLFTIIIYQVNSMSQLHLVSEILLKMYIWEQMTLLALKKKYQVGYFFKKGSVKRVLLFCCIRCCPYSVQ